MKPQYVVTAGSPLIIQMDNNRHMFGVSVRTAAGQTVEVALEDITDPVTAPNSPGPVWLPASVSTIPNFYKISTPVRLLRITGAGTATVLEQGFEDDEVMSIQELLFKNGEPGYFYSIYNPDSLYPHINWLTSTEDLTIGAVWTSNAGSSGFVGIGTAAVVTPNAGVAPDGTLTADRVVLNLNGGANAAVAANRSGMAQVGLATNVGGGEKWTTSVYLKPLGGGNLFDLSPTIFKCGCPSAPNPDFFTIVPLADGWYRLISVETMASTQIGSIRYQLLSAPGSTVNILDALVWGFQFEKGDQASKYQRVITDWNTEYLANVPYSKIVMWQDVAKTLPVTTVGQQIALLTDNRMGAGTTPGQELLLDPLLNDPAKWAVTGSGTSVTGGVFNWVASSSGSLIQVLSTDRIVCGVGEQIYWKYTVDSISPGGTLRVVIAGTSNASDNVTAPGTYEGILTATTGGVTLQQIAIRCVGVTTAVVSSFSVKRTDGNKANQPTAASRWILQALYNKLVKTEQLADVAAWANNTAGLGVTPIRTANYAADPNGNMTATRIQLNITGSVSLADQSGVAQTSPVTLGASYVGGVWLKATDAGNVGKKVLFRHAGGTAYQTHTLTTSWARVGSTETAGSGSAVFGILLRGASGVQDTVDFLAWGADLRPLDDVAPGIPPYQRVNTLTDYDTAGFPHYGQSDGADDWMQTVVPVDFSGVDKSLQVAAITKASDAAIGTIQELTTTSFTNPGFGSFAPGSIAANFSMITHGSAPAVQAVASNHPAPLTAVVTGVGDISGDLAQIRINGVVRQTTVTDQGTGNYSNAIVYFGRRGGTTFTINGRIYSILARGSTVPTDPATIFTVEQILAAAAGRTL